MPLGGVPVGGVPLGGVPVGVPVGFGGGLPVGVLVGLGGGLPVGVPVGVAEGAGLDVAAAEVRAFARAPAAETLLVARIGGLPMAEVLTAIAPSANANGNIRSFFIEFVFEWFVGMD